MAFVLLLVALTTAAYTQVLFPTGDNGQYGFLMTAVQKRVPLANSGGVSVTQPPYNSSYSTFGDSGSPINPSQYYGGTAPFSTSRWWSRLACQKSNTQYTAGIGMPYTYTGVFNLYRSITMPYFGFSISRPYTHSLTEIDATNVCGQVGIGMFKTRSSRLSDGAPTFFAAPTLWDLLAGVPLPIPTRATYSVREIGNMSVEMTYESTDGLQRARIQMSQITPYISITLKPGTSICLNSYYRDSRGDFERFFLVDIHSSFPSVTLGATMKQYRTTVYPPFLGDSPIGLSQTSITRFSMAINPPATVSHLLSGDVIVTASNSTLLNTTLTLLPEKYYIATPINPSDPNTWVDIDTAVVGKILSSRPVLSLSAFVSSTSRNGYCTLTYASDSGQAITFVPSLSMLTAGVISGAEAITPLPQPAGVNRWLTPQGPTSVYQSSTGSFNVSYPLIVPPPLGKFDIYSAFDANSLRRLSFIFNRDLQALYVIDVANDSFNVSVNKIFTFAQMTYAIANFPAELLVDVYLPPLRKHLFDVFEELITSSRQEIRLGYNSQLFTVATGNQEYGASQNASFGDNHVGQYGMMLFTYYILVSLQFDDTARRYMRDRYQSIMVDLMRDFAQPYTTDQYISSMRHFDYGVGLSWQNSSIVEASSLQVAQVINGYYASWLVSTLFGDVKLRDFYRAILSIELATHQNYRLVPLSSSGGSTSNQIYSMREQATSLFRNIPHSVMEGGFGSPGNYSPNGATVYLLQGGELILHGVRNQHPDYRYLVEFVSPNSIGDFTANSYFHPMTPMTTQLVPLSMGISLGQYMMTTFGHHSALNSLNGALSPRVTDSASSPEIFSFDSSTGLPVSVLSLESTVASYTTTQAAYNLDQYAMAYVLNYTWAGANIPPDTCSVIPSNEVPDYLIPVMQYNKLGFRDSNTVLWIMFVITAYGPRK